MAAGTARSASSFSDPSPSAASMAACSSGDGATWRDTNPSGRSSAARAERSSIGDGLRNRASGGRKPPVVFPQQGAYAPARQITSMLLRRDLPLVLVVGHQ